MTPAARDVVFYEVFAEEEEAIRRHWPAKSGIRFYENTIQESGHTDPPARIISIRTQSILPAHWPQQLDALLTRSTGYDHLAAFIDTNLQLGYLPEYCARSVAEHAMLLWTALLKKLPAAMNNMTSFNRSGITGSELEGKRLLVVGVGHIGVEVARLASALGMQVQGMDIEHRHSAIEYVEAGVDVSCYDVIVCAMNLTADNYAFFDQAFFDTVKPGCIFINIARGEMSPHDVLLAALRNGRLGGVGLDVFDNEAELARELREQAEPGAAARTVQALAQHPNVILTPHNAFNTAEATARKAERSVQQLTGFLDSGRFIWSVPAHGSIQRAHR